jgi:MFS family permease
MPAWNRLPRGNVWGRAILGCTCLIPLLISPIITGILVDHGGMTDSQAGVTAGFGAIGAILIALLCAIFMHHLPLRQLATAGLLLAAVTNLVSALVYEQHGIFYALRAMNSLGDGACYAAVMSSYARESNSERCYGLFMTLQFGLSAAAMFVLSTYLPALTVTQLYLIIAGCNLLALPLVRLLPAAPAQAAGVVIRASEWRLILTVPALAGLGALCFFEASNTANAAYVERIAVLADLDDQQIGAALGISSLAGVPGAFAILWLGARFGHVKPVLAGIFIGALALLVLMSASSFTAYLLAICTLSMTWAFTLPYLQSVLADQDPGGAVVTAGGIASGAGGGLGPAAASTLVSATDYSGVLVVGLTAYLMAAVFIVLGALLTRGWTNRLPAA